MKTFKRNYQPIEVEIESTEGQMFTLKSVVLFTPEVTDEIEKICDDKSSTGATRAINQMVKIFGNDFDFYKKFEVGIMNDVLTYVGGEVSSASKKNR